MRLILIIFHITSLFSFLLAQDAQNPLVSQLENSNELEEKIKRAADYDALGDIEYQKLNLKAADSLYDLALNNATLDSLIIQLYLKKVRLSIKGEDREDLLYFLNQLDIFYDRGKLNNTDQYHYHSLWAQYYQQSNDFINELDHLFKAKRIIIPTDHEKMLNLNRELSIVYFRLQDYDASLQLFKEDLSISQEQKDSVNIMFSYYGIGDSYLELNRFEEVKNVCYQAMGFREKSRVSQSFGFIYYLLGTVYYEEQKLDSAYHYAYKGITISEDQKEKKELSDNYLLMTNLLLLEGDTVAAQVYAEKAFRLRNHHEAGLNLNLAKIYESQKEYSKANVFLRKNLNYYEKINDKNFVFNLANRLLLEKFEQENINQIALEKQKFQKRQIQLILLGAALLFALFLIIIGIQNSNKKKIQKANSDLLEKNEELQYFAYICSHDLKESIRNIGSFSSLLKFKLKNEDLKFNPNEYLNVIEMGASTLTNIVDSLQVFTSIKDDKIIDKTHFPLVPLINKVEQSLFQLIQEKEATISIHNELDDRHIYSSENELFLIFQNIIQNAIKHNQSENILVDIRIFQKNGDVVISIKDNGEGISADYFDYIFMPFKTLKNKSISNTSGLGLTICAKLIQKIGGEISVESKMGEGSTFYVSLGENKMPDV